MHTTTLISVHYAINKEKNQHFQERPDQECSVKVNILKTFRRFFKITVVSNYCKHL